MKNSLFSILILLWSYPVCTQIVWTKTTLTDEFVVSCMVSSGTDIYAGLKGAGIYKSEDNGTTWQQMNEGLGDKFILSLLINGNIMYASSLGEGVYKSEDKGESWTAFKSSPSDYIYAFGYSGSNLIACTKDGIFYSNSDEKWEKATIEGTRQHSMAYSILNTKKGLLAGSGQFVFKSSDDGETWTSHRTSTLFDINTFIERENEILIGSSGDGLLSSSDGLNWSQKLPSKSESELKNVTSMSKDSSGLLVASSITNILNDGEKMINGKGDLRASVIHFHNGFYFASTYISGLWRLESGKNISKLEPRNSLELNSIIFPNPTPRHTTIIYSINQPAKIVIDIVYTDGKICKHLSYGVQSSGTYQLNINDLGLTPGLYFMRIQADNEYQLKKLIIID